MRPFAYERADDAAAAEPHGIGGSRIRMVSGGRDHARTKAAAEASWLKGLWARRPAKPAAVAPANKTARIVRALLTRGGTYRPPGRSQAAAA